VALYFLYEDVMFNAAGVALAVLPEKYPSVDALPEHFKVPGTAALTYERR
jgi:hypothetical protein